MTMKPEQLQYAITALSNLLTSGISPADSLREMGHLQPAYKAYWLNASQQAAHGIGLATILKPLLDEAMYAALQAAELSGSVTTVLSRLERAMEEKKLVRKTIKSMTYPFAMLVGAIGVLMLYLAFVVPAFSRAMPARAGRAPSALQVVGDGLNSFFVNFWIHMVVGAVLAVIGIGMWLRDPTNRNTLLTLFDRVPLLGPAARDLFYGEWATHMAINTHAGITVLDAIRLTDKILPDYYRTEVRAVAKDITRLGQAEAAQAQGPDDPRRKIPFAIINAFRLGDRTGVIDTNFENAAKTLIAQGQLRINYFVNGANSVATPLAALLGAGAMLPYFYQLIDSLSHVR